MSELGKTADLKCLVSQRKQRPSYTRMISWEFSSAAEFNRQKAKRKGKRQSQTQDTAGGDSGDDSEQGLSGDTIRGQNVEAEEDSSDGSEYFSAFEDELELSSWRSESLGESSTLVLEEMSAGSSHRSQGGSLETDNAESVDDVFRNLEKSGELQPGRRRRLSKKQKRKRCQKFKIAFANDFACIGNVCDSDFDVEQAFTMADGSIGSSQVERQVPSLMELCLRVSSTSNIPSDDTRCQVPGLIKEAMKDWNRHQSFIARQLSWLQNSLLPLFSMEKNCKFNTVFESCKNSTKRMCFSTRSVWECIPMYEDPRWNGSGGYKSSKAVSYLLCCNLQHLPFTPAVGNWEYDDFISGDSNNRLTILSALATAIDLMMPQALKGRSLTLTDVTEHEKLQRASRIVAMQVKQALKARFPALVEALFDFALPYVMWARGNITMATELFKELLNKEKRRRLKAMFLSEIARMHAMFGDRDVARKFHRLASEVVLEDHFRLEAALVAEVTEQTSVLEANLYDQGQFSATKMFQAQVAWNSVLSLPNQRLETVIAAIESFLCYHAGYWTDTDLSWLEEAKARIEKVLKNHSYLKYYLSLVYALMGQEKEALRTYRASVPTPGWSFRQKLEKPETSTPWHPLLCMVQQQQSPPIRPLKVVWRSQLQPARYSKHSLTLEADIRSEALNLRLNDEGLLTGDMQMVLPPLRSVTLDPYTGTHVVSRVPGTTEPWQDVLDLEKHKACHHFVPTLQEVYCDEKGTRVHLLSPSVDMCTLPVNSTGRSEVIAPAWLFYQNKNGERGRKNLLLCLKTLTKESLRRKVETRPTNAVFTEKKKAWMLEMIQVLYNRNLALTMAELENCCQARRSAENRQYRLQKQGKPNKLKRYHYLVREISVPRLVKSPVVYGRSVVMEFLYCHINYLVFVNSESRLSFLDMKIMERGQLQLDYFGPVSPGDTEYVLLYDSSDRGICVYNQHGDFVQKVCKPDSLRSWNVNSVCLFGPCIYICNCKDLSIKKTIIGVTLDKRNGSSDDLSKVMTADEKECDVYWPQLLGPYMEDRGEELKVEFLTTAGGALLCHWSHGVCFLDTDSVCPLPITVACTTSLQLTPDNVLIKGNFENVDVLKEKGYNIDGQSVTRVALVVDFHLLIVELTTSQTSKLTVSVSVDVVLPGIPQEVCLLGNEVGFLVTVSHQSEEEDYYREHLFYFNFHGNLCGVLPFLGPGRRSFFPVYLHGDANKDSAQSIPGWYVYLRDGHNGIMAVRLSDNLHVPCAVP